MVHDTANDITFKNIKTHGAGQDGIYVSYKCYQVRILECDSYDNAGSGITTYADYAGHGSATIAGSICHENRRNGILIDSNVYAPGEEINIFSSLIYGNDWNGIAGRWTILSLSNATVADNGGGFYTSYTDHETHIYNCIISSNLNYGIFDRSEQGIVTDYNDLYSNQIDYGGAASAGPHSFSSDPMFNNQTGRDYSLKDSHSPCYRAGSIRFAPQKDCRGEDFSDPPNVGAFAGIAGFTPTPGPPTPSLTVTPIPTATRPPTPSPTASPTATPPIPTSTPTRAPSPSPSPSVNIGVDILGAVSDRLTGEFLADAMICVTIPACCSARPWSFSNQSGEYLVFVCTSHLAGTLRVDVRRKGYAPAFREASYSGEYPSPPIHMDFQLDPALLPSGTGRRDFDGDGTSDIAFFRPCTGEWSIRGITRLFFGDAGARPIPEDFAGDGTAKIAIWRPDTGLWAIMGLTRTRFGISGDTPIPSDFDGDGAADLAVFRNTGGLWAVRQMTRIFHGTAGDWPVTACFRGNLIPEIAVFRPSSGLWAISGFTRMYWGSSGDWPAVGDYADDGTGQVAVFQPGLGLWSIRGITRAYFGTACDWALPADYNGDGRDEAAIFRDSSGMWSVRNLTRIYFGSTGDIPVTR